MSLELIAELSREFGSDTSYVIAGGGNTSFKDGDSLWIKPSGVALANMTEKDFVRLDRAKVRELFTKELPACAEAREEEAKNLLLAAVMDGAALRPSVEAPLHELISFAFVVHTHPTLVNALTCGKEGEKIAKELFPEALFIPYADPGVVLSITVSEGIKEYKKAKGCDPKVIFLQNHGVFVASNCADEIRSIYKDMMTKLADCCSAKGIAPVAEEKAVCQEAIKTIAPKLRTILGSEGENGVIQRKFIVCAGNFVTAEDALIPDQIVYARSRVLKSDAPTMEEVKAFEAKYGYKPQVVEIPGRGVFCAGNTLKEARTAAEITRCSSEINRLAAAFGGTLYMSEKGRTFIENWEAEAYRKKSAAGKDAGRLAGKVAVITGAAQGFGYGIAEELAREGAVIVIADMNQEGAAKAADEIRALYPQSQAFAVAVNVSDENSVEAMAAAVAEKCGGIDLFVANAGVVRAGSVKEITLKDWEFVTNINYNGYFLCVKHVARLMACQTADGGDWLDIVQVNSKSGLQGSNKNGAYAGGKFGGIGLTQSFAMELVTDHIKVNSVCPGNFFDGPLWSNPEKGLFVQYLNSGKVPGAKTVADVKKFYESKIPMNRGCFPADVAKAILYAVEQKYETGQAIPVTGGQVMLK